MFDILEKLAECTGFQWDAGNTEKNWLHHRVRRGECEQVFFNRPIRVAPDLKHSDREKRYAALGQTSSGRLLTVVFTIRNECIRIISAHAMNRRERSIYEQEEIQ